MKCLTLTQPWATLVAIGAKKIETRSWHTAYRGPLAIHAAKGFPADARDVVYTRPFLGALRRNYGTDTLLDKQLPVGCVVAVGQLVACTLISLAFEEQLGDQERAFGNYDAGRFAWVLEDIRPLPDPVPAKGHLSLWEWEGK